MSPVRPEHACVDARGVGARGGDGVQVCTSDLAPLTYRLGYEELPFSKRLKKIKELLEQSNVPISAVVLELGKSV